jgi:hypothetical protein
MARTTQKARPAAFWLIVGGDREGIGAKPLVLDLLGEEEGALAVFSFVEEAQMYLQDAAPQGSWRAEEVEAGELVSMLVWGSCSQVKWVALDPMPPQVVDSCEANQLVCTHWQDFLGLLRGDSEEAAMVRSRREG